MNANDIKNEYFSFIKENAVFNNITDNHTEVITPFVDPFGEAIGFNVKSNGKSLTITDDDFTVWNLQINGVDVTKKDVDKNYSNQYFNTMGSTLLNILSKKQRLRNI